MKFSEILPSKWLQRIIIIVLGCLVVGLITQALVKKYKENQQKKEAGIEVSYVDLNDEVDNRDDDEDGVPNWEEILWGLDPQKPDTDGDGVTDGEYVDRKKMDQLREDLGIQNVSSGLSESEELGRSLYTALLAIEQSGATLDAETGEQISDNIVNYIESIPVGGELFLREDLNLVPNTKESTYAYRDRMQQLFTQYPIQPEDVELIAYAVENPAAYETRLNRLSNQYISLVAELSTMEVPFAIAGRHTELLNSVNHLSGTFMILNEEQPDEIVLLSAVAQMQEILADAAESVTYMEMFFETISDESVFEYEI